MDVNERDGDDLEWWVVVWWRRGGEVRYGRCVVG